MADRCMRRNLQEQGDDVPMAVNREAFLALMMNPELVLQWAETMRGGGADSDGEEEEEESDDDDDAPIPGLD